MRRLLQAFVDFEVALRLLSLAATILVQLSLFHDLLDLGLRLHHER